MERAQSEEPIPRRRLSLLPLYDPGSYDADSNRPETPIPEAGTPRRPRAGPKPHRRAEFESSDDDSSDESYRTEDSSRPAGASVAEVLYEKLSNLTLNQFPEMKPFRFELYQNFAEWIDGWK